MSHLLLVGSQNMGRSALIRRLLAEAEVPLPVTGFQTIRAATEDETGSRPIYIHPFPLPGLCVPENRVGWCKAQRPRPDPAAFDRFAPRLESMPENGLLVMDGLGILESGSPLFQSAVQKKLDRCAMVLAAVRDKDTPFLRAVRGHPRARCFFIPDHGAECHYQEALRFLQAQFR